jgi:two-component system, chemotaxis family, chemotaxis protein CheY
MDLGENNVIFTRKIFRVNLYRPEINFMYQGVQMARVLIVDDAKFMRTLVKDALSSAGHTIVGEAENGNIAIDMYNNLKPDLVTMDITMREKDGLEAAGDILKKDPSARIIMVTALGQEDLLARAIKMGVKDFVVKPFPPERLQQAAAKALA